MLSSTFKRKLTALPLRAASASSSLGRSHFSSSTAAHASSAGSSKATGPLPAYGLVGVSKALEAPPSAHASPTLFSHEFSLADRVALVTGAQRGIGLEMALALAEAGARAVYCVDLPREPDAEFGKVAAYAAKLDGRAPGATFEYLSADVTDQEAMWKLGETIGSREGRMDVCIAAAGILKGDMDCLDYPAKQFRQVHAVNVDGVLFTAQAAGRQMAKFDNGGSIILIGSISGSGANPGHPWVSYNTSKSAVLQMARSMACELAPKRIRVNTISPGYINTTMIGKFLEQRPELLSRWQSNNPMGRIGRPDELRGVTAWLASDASTYCTGSDVRSIIVSGGHHAW
ncbi:sorbose reductase sou1 [Lenzites betulinus]|nr:sorbose reductase sou1 [Lenzites betulinus]